jgi:hypothetical protein
MSACRRQDKLRQGWIQLCYVGVALVLIGCGAVPATGSASAARTDSPSPPSSSPSPSPSGAWQVYTDQQYAFSISYPSNVTFQSQGSGPPGGLQVYRAVDNRYLRGEPPGQVEVDLLSMDADTLRAWVAKHTGPAEAPSNQEFYWGSVSNLAATTAVSRPALSFDNSAEGFPTTVHAIVFLQDPSRVILVDWWSTDPTYAPTIEAVFQQMLTSLRA